MLQPGVIVERYRVLRALGDGGMGAVYLVQHEKLGTRRALKVLHLSRPAIADRLLREGQVQASLQHDNVVSVLDVLSIGPMPALLMEFIDGPNLLQAQRSVPLSLKAIDALARDVLRGVGAAHSRGWVHRDLKPANVLLKLRPDSITAKVTDFGLAKILDAGDSGNTRSGVTMGTPGYMAPEQLRDSASVDARADVFSLGCMLYELLTGAQPFFDVDQVELIRKVCEGSFVPVGSARPDAPARMQQAITSALLVDREARPNDASELLELWEAGVALEQPAFRADELAGLRALVPADDGAVPTPSGGWTSSGASSPMTWMASPDDGEPAPSPPGGEISETWFEGPPDSLVKEPSSEPELGRRSLDSLPPPNKTGRRVWIAVAAGLVVTGLGLWWGLTPSESPASELHWAPDGLRAVPLRSREARSRDHLRVSLSGERVVQARSVTSAGFPHAEVFSGKESGELPRPFGVWTEEHRDGHTYLIHRNPRGLILRQARIEVVDGGITLTHLGPEGHPTPTDKWELPELLEGVFGHRLTFDAQGRLVELRALGPSGDPMRAADATYGRRLSYDDRGRVVERVALGADGLPTPDRSGVVREHLSYAGGHRQPSSISTFGIGDVPVAGPSAVHVEERSYDDEGRLLERRGLLDGEPSELLPTACATLRLEYTGALDASVSCLDRAGDPAWSREGWSRYDISWDERGYRSGSVTYGVDGERINRKAGFAQDSAVHDDMGWIVHFGPLLGADGAPVVSRSLGYVARRWTLDELGRHVLTVNEGADGKPKVDILGAAMTRRTHDEVGRAIRATTLDVKGQPVANIYGCATRILEHDERGRMMNLYFLDVTDSPVPDVDGVTRYAYRYDDFDRLVSLTSFDETGSPVIDRGTGAAEVRYRYDQEGNEVWRGHFGLAGEIIDGADGWHEQTQTFDRRGNVVETRQLNAQRELVPQDPLGAEILREQVDAASRTIALHGFDSQGRPVRGCASIYYTVDHLGNFILTRCEDGSGRPAALPMVSAYQVRQEYDSLGRVVATDFLDDRGELVTATGRTARLEYVFQDGHAQHSALHFLGPDREPTEEPNGMSRVEIELDAFGRAAVQRTYSRDGELAKALGGGTCAVQRFAYTLGDRVTEQRCYDEREQPATEVPYLTLMTYDDALRERVKRYLDPQERPVDGLEGWAERRTIYDQRGARTLVSWLAADGSCGHLQGEVCAKQVTVDAVGAEVRTTFLDAEDNPVAPRALGYAAVELVRDGSGRVIERRYLGVDDEPAADVESGAARIVFELGPSGAVVAERRYDLGGEEIISDQVP